MRGVVYVDVLVLVNAVIAMFLLRCTARLSGVSLGFLRMAWAGAAAGFSSLMLLLPPMSALLLTAAKAASAGAIVLLAFGGCGVRRWCKTLFWYLMLNLVLSGVVFAAVYYTQTGNVESNNLTFYINVSPAVLFFCVCGVYLAVRLCETAFGRPQRHPHSAFVCEICMEGECAKMHGVALCDTGFSLRDTFTGEDAFLLSFPAVKNALPKPLQNALQRYYDTGELSLPLHLVTTQTVSGIKCLPAMRAESLTVQGVSLGKRLAVFSPEVLGAGNFDAIIGG